MRIQARRTTAAIALVMGLLAVGTLPAQATPANNAAPAGEASPAATAGEPTTSPAPRKRYRVPAGVSIDCPSGAACAVTNYDANGGWLFEFYAYATYSLSEWRGQNGAVVNTQTGNAGMRLLDRNGNVLRCVPAGTGDNGVNWDPVWFIRLSSAPC